MGMCYIRGVICVSRLSGIVLGLLRAMDGVVWCCCICNIYISSAVSCLALRGKYAEIVNVLFCSWTGLGESLNKLPTRLHFSRIGKLFRSWKYYFYKNLRNLTTPNIPKAPSTPLYQTHRLPILFTLTSQQTRYYKKRIVKCGILQFLLFNQKQRYKMLADKHLPAASPYFFSSATILSKL